MDKYLSKIIIITFLLMFLPIAAMAQKGLNVNAIFEKYHNSKNAVEVIVKGKQLRGYNISYFHSITITGTDAELLALEQAVMHDAAKAKESESGKIGGHLYYGFYRFNGGNDDYRYIIFRNRSLKKGAVNDATIIYIEGSASMNELKTKFK